jgi:hypothetical protein
MNDPQDELLLLIHHQYNLVISRYRHISLVPSVIIFILYSLESVGRCKAALLLRPN